MMKLGTQTASLVNHLHSRATLGQPVPVVGMGATFLSWTDRSAGTIVSVEALKSKRYEHLVGVTYDEATMTGGSGMSESQEYSFKTRPDAPVYLFASQRDGGGWIRVERAEDGKRLKQVRCAGGLRIGERDHYRDPTF